MAGVRSLMQVAALLMHVDCAASKIAPEQAERSPCVDSAGGCGSKAHLEASLQAESQQLVAEFPSLVQVAMHSSGLPVAALAGLGRPSAVAVSEEASQPNVPAQVGHAKSSAQAVRQDAGWFPRVLEYKVVTLFVILGALSALSVGLYLRSLGQPEEEEEPPPVAPAERQITKSNTLTVSEIPAMRATMLAQNSMAGGESVRPRHSLGRRNTVIIGELTTWKLTDDNGTMSEVSFVINMLADLGPTGFLPLTSGLSQTGYVPAFLILIAFYFICVYTMYSVARTIHIAGGQDYASLWATCVSSKTTWVPVFIVVSVCFGTLISYSCFFADIFAGVMPTFGLNTTRTECLMAFTLFPVLPLCLVKNLSALSPTSSFALVATLYTVGVMVFRWQEGSYTAQGRFFKDLEPQFVPNVPSNHLTQIGMPSLVLVNSLALGFLTHYNGCKYYRELVDHNPTRLAYYTRIGMGIIAVLFATVMIAGFQTFGTNASPVILQNYSRNDTYVNIARLGMGFSIVASFPLMFSGLREAVIELLKQLSSDEKKEDWDLIWRQDSISMLLLAMITTIAALVTNAGLVVGVVGALCGISIIYIVPAVLYSGAIHVYLPDENNYGTLNFLRFLVFMGALLAVGGCTSTLFF